jgi:uncharacterized protein
VNLPLNNPLAAIESPCVQVCVIDPVTGFCIGCGRTGAEIGSWIGLAAGQRREIMGGLPERLRTMTSRDARCITPRTRYRDRG